MNLLPAPLRELIQRDTALAKINPKHKYPYFLLADTNIEEQRTFCSEKIDVVSEGYHISIDSIVAVTPKKTTITLHQIGGSFAPSIRRAFSSLQRYDQEEIATLDLGDTYPPAGHSRLHDPYRIIQDNIHALSEKYLPYVGRGIFLDNNYWSLGLFGQWRAENLQTGNVVEKKKRIAHYHYEYRDEGLPGWLIFVDVGRDDMPAADTLRDQEIGLVCREAIKELGRKYLLPKKREEITDNEHKYLQSGFL